MDQAGAKTGAVLAFRLSLPAGNVTRNRVTLSCLLSCRQFDPRQCGPWRDVALLCHSAVPQSGAASFLQGNPAWPINRF